MDRLDESRANIIRNAIVNDGTFCGTDEWLESHYIDREEFLAFLEYGVRLSKMYDYRDSHADAVGAIKIIGEIKDKLTVKASSYVITVETSEGSVDRLRNVLGQNVVIQIFNEQMPLPFDEADVAQVNLSTGELM